MSGRGSEPEPPKVPGVVGGRAGAGPTGGQGHPLCGSSPLCKSLGTQRSSLLLPFLHFKCDRIISDFLLLSWRGSLALQLLTPVCAMEVILRANK